MFPQVIDGDNQNRLDIICEACPLNDNVHTLDRATETVEHICSYEPYLSEKEINSLKIALRCMVEVKYGRQNVDTDKEAENQ